MRTTRTRIAWGAFAALLLLGATALADQNAAYRKYKGQIVVAADTIPDEFDVPILKKIAKSVLTRDGEGPWAFNFVGFLKSKPGTSPINFVFYDVSTKGKRTFVTAKEIVIDPGSNILMSRLEVSEDDGLEAGHIYELLLARMVGNKETVYAKTKLTLK